MALHFCISEGGTEGVGSQVGWRVGMRNGGLQWDCGITVSALDSVRTQLRSTPYSKTLACLDLWWRYVSDMRNKQKNYLWRTSKAVHSKHAYLA